MFVLFLEIDTERDWAVASIGPAFLAGVLRARGHRVAMVRVAPDAPAEAVAADLARRSPDLLALSLTSRQWLRAREVVAAVRKELDVPVIAGGLHPTFSPDAVLASEGFDYVCLGEGEQALLELVEHLAAIPEDAGIDPGIDPGLDNIWAVGGSRPRLRPPFEPLDDLPFLARDLLDEHPGVVHMTTQRGCPFPCTYCAARKYDDLYRGNGSYGRRRSHESVLAELDRIRAAGPLYYVIFLDDTFTIDKRWVARFCELYGERFRVPFSIHARVETVDAQSLQRLAAAGCRHVTYGVESGSLRVRREIMRRPITDERILQVFAWTKDAGILATANYMLGLPGETRADVEATLALHQKIRPDDFGYFVFYPYPGTHLFDLCRERGYLPEDYLSRPAVHRETILDLPDLSRADIAFYYDRFTELRAATQVARLGTDPDPASQRAILADVRANAETG